MVLRSEKISGNGGKVPVVFALCFPPLYVLGIFCLEKVIKKMRCSVLLLGGKGMFTDKMRGELEYKGRREQWLCSSNGQ